MPAGCVRAASLTQTAPIAVLCPGDVGGVPAGQSRACPGMLGVMWGQDKGGAVVCLEHGCVPFRLAWAALSEEE